VRGSSLHSEPESSPLQHTLHNVQRTEILNYLPPLAALNIQGLTKPLASLRAKIDAVPMQTSQSSKCKVQRTEDFNKSLSSTFKNKLQASLRASAVPSLLLSLIRQEPSTRTEATCLLDLLRRSHSLHSEPVSSPLRRYNAYFTSKYKGQRLPASLGTTKPRFPLSYKVSDQRTSLTVKAPW
jgi:hypothetical protein